MIQRLKEWAREKSPWVYTISLGTCNGCEIECVASFTPKYDIERFGCKLVGSPRHADIVLFTGSVSEKAKKRFKRVWEKVPEPKVSVAVGACPLSGGVFKGNEEINPPLDKHIDVDVYIPGCPPKPQAIIKGLGRAIKKLKEK